MVIINRRLVIMLLAAAALLLIPLIAMQFTEEVQWNIPDFLVMGGLLFGICVAIEVALRATKKVNHRAVIVAVIILLFLLVWAELAVGIFGSPFAGD